MITPEPAVSHGNGLADWVFTAVLALWGFVVSHLTAPDWVTSLTTMLLMVKIAHELFRFLQTWRRAGARRGDVDTEG